MAVTESNYTVSNSSTTNYSFTFPYLKTTDVKLSINGVASSAFTFANATTIQLNSNPTVGDKLRIYRETDDSKLEAEFFAGSAIKSSDLNDNFNQNLYVTQESNNKIDAAWTSGDETIDSTETWASNNTRVATTGAIDGRVDSKIDTALTTDVVGGQSITITDNSPGSGQITASVTAGSIRGTELAGDAVDGTKIADDSIDSEHYVAGSIDLEHMSANSVDSDQYVDGSIDSAHMSANSVATGAIVDGAVTNAKLANSSISLGGVSMALGTTDATPSFNLQDATGYETSNLNGTITTAQVADANITTAKIADSSVTTSKIATSAVGTSRLNNGAVTTDKLAADAVDSSKLADNSIDSEHYVDGSIDTAHLGDLQVTTAKIAADAIDGTKLADNAVSAEHIAANAVGDSEISTGALDNRYYTETELNAGQLDNRYYTETESDARYFNVSTGDTIKDGDTFPDNDTTIATTAAINDRIIDLVDDVGGFVPIANETSFPNANPDVNNGTGTIVSIGSLAANHTSNGSGVITIANGTVGNSTVTINGADNSTTYSAGYGMLVETTSTLNTYTFHRLSSKATEVTTVASNITNINTVGNNNTNINTVAGANSNITTVAGSISNVNTTAGSIANVNTVATNINSVNDFSDVYRIASSAPTSHLHEGDLYFDTTSNELKVYNGSAWQGGVTATGNLAGLGANTFTGSQSLGDNNKVQLGAGNDLQIYHDGSNSYIDDAGTGNLYLRGSSSIELRKAGGTEKMLYAEPDAQVELYYDNSKKFDTQATGVKVYGDYFTNDSNKINLGTGNDLQLYHDGSNSWIVNNHASSFYIRSNGNLLLEHTNGENYVKGGANGTVQLYYDGVNKFETTSTGIAIAGGFTTTAADCSFTGTTSGRDMLWDTSRDALTFKDNAYIELGTGTDLQIYHDGSHSYLKNTSGNIRIFSSGSSEAISIVADGAVSLSHANAVKLATYASGITASGNLAVSADNTYDLGASGARWRDLFISNDIDLIDAGKLLLGASDDLQIFHDASDSYINNSTGVLYLRGDTLSLNATSTTDKYLYATNGGATELYYDGVKKFETQSGGVKWTGNATSDGNVWWTDGKKAQFGASNDLEIYHNSGSNKSIIYHSHASGVLSIAADHLNLADYNSEHPFITCDRDGAVELYYDNSKKLETISTGVRLSGLEAGEVWAEFYADEGDDNADKWRMGASVNTDYYLQNYAGGSWETNIKAIGNGAVELYHDATKKFETSSSGVTVTGNVDLTGSIELADSEKVTFGAGTDLQIYHDGSNSFIKNSTNTLVVLTAGMSINDTANAESMAQFYANGAAELYYDNAKKLETDASGVTLGGRLSLGDNYRVNLGDDADLSLIHDGTNSTIDNMIILRFLIKKVLMSWQNFCMTEPYNSITTTVAS